jgi:hypothetical protein
MLEECLWYSTTDRLGATIGALGDALRWPVPAELMRMRAAPAPHTPPTDEERELVAERSPVDVRLYEYASATVGRHEAPLTRAVFDATLADAAFPLDRPLAIELREPFWGEGWWAPQLTDEKRWARWTAFDRPATVDAPVSLRAGDRIEVCFVATRDPSYVTGLAVEVNDRPTRLLGVVPRAPHFVGTVEVTADVDRWSHISILPPSRGESMPYEPVHTEGKVFAIEKLLLLPGAR